MWGMIATWRMAYEGVIEASEQLRQNQPAGNAIVTTIKSVEDIEYFKSVGYGGLPNEAQQVELDAAYMDGDTLQFGGVGAIKDFANPVCIAKQLSTLSVNNFLVGVGADTYAQIEGYERKNMLTERAKKHYQRKIKEIQVSKLKPYDGHDTIGVVGLDQKHSMAVATSTSGLFMKKPGRVGDSPIVGSGLYVDSEIGGASATGLGEDLMKGCMSYEIVRLMKDGKTPQLACEQAIQQLQQRLRKTREVVGDLSVIAMNQQGAWGAASNIEGFSFVVATESMEPTVFLCESQSDGTCLHRPVTQAWMDDYIKVRMVPLD